MWEDPQGRLWLDTPEGVFCWKDGRVAPFYHRRWLADE